MPPIRRDNRRRKPTNQKDVTVKRRSLTDLPDGILSHIVSFLPTKDAVRTSVLSTRWEFIWTTIPRLCFIQGNEETTKYMNFIKRALSLRGSSKITKFSLKGNMDASLSVQTVISAVALRKVEEFELQLDEIKEALNLPISLLNSSTLTRLNVRMRGQKLVLPFLIYLPSLKLLNLWGITFPNQYSTQNLFSGCLVLEDLQLIGCNWLNVKTVRVVSPKLHKLSIREDHEGPRNERNRLEFIIQGSGLRYFTHVGLLHFDYCIANPTLLEGVTINIDSFHQNSVIMTNRLLKILRRVSRVPKLMLGPHTISLLLGVPQAVNNLPMLLSVQGLELAHGSSDFSNIGLLKILEKTPCLQSLTFHEGLMKPSNPIEDAIMDPVPSCFLNRLSHVFVHVFCGSASDLEGIKVILKNAKVLRRMEVLLGLLVSSETRNRFPLELLKLPRASKECGVFVL